MNASAVPAVTGPSELACQIEHPSAELIWARAVEVFSGEAAASRWMESPLPALDGLTPSQLARTGDAGKQREVLILLNRIDFGMLS